MSAWVLLRGLTRESRHWGTFPGLLRGQLPAATVCTPDLPGNGRLCAERSPTDVAAMAERCRGQLQAQGVAPPYQLLAMSLGAMVAVAWAQRRPEEIGGCVLINTSLRPFSPFPQRLRPANYLPLIKLLLPGTSVAQRERTILALTSRGGGDARALVDDWVAWHREAPVAAANALRQLAAALRYRAPAAGPAVPLLVLASRLDGLVDPACSRQLARRWQTAYAEHPTAGHDLPLDDGPWVAAQVRRWAERVLPEGRAGSADLDRSSPPVAPGRSRGAE